MTTKNTIRSLTVDFQNQESVKFQTGIKEFVRFNVHVSPGRVLVLGSRPSAGRTLFLLHLFYNIWKTEGVSQCFITNEESAQELYTRLAAMVTGVERLKLREQFDPQNPENPEILNSVQDFILERCISWEELREEMAMLASGKGVRVFYIEDRKSVV